MIIIKEILSLMIKFIFSPFVFIIPKTIYLWLARKLLLNRFYPSVDNFAFTLSGRTAIVALLSEIKKLNSGNRILIPDYVCNILHKCAVYNDFQVETYKLNPQYNINLADLEEKAQNPHVSIVILASIFGAQNYQIEIIKRLRKVNKDIFIIFDECQNLISNNQLKLVERSALVSSFNNKTIQGTMGGFIGYHKRDFPTGFSRINNSHPLQLELKILNLYYTGIWQELKKSLRNWLIEKPTVNGSPPIEFSYCVKFPYTLKPLPIAKISLIRGIFGMLFIKTIEKKRRQRFHRFKEIIHQQEIGDLINTDEIELSPFVPFQPKKLAKLKSLPLKGPYAIPSDPEISLRADSVYIINNHKADAILNDIERRLLNSRQDKSKPQHDMKSQHIAIICSTYINAIGIAESLVEIGWPDRIIFLAIGESLHNLSEQYPLMYETLNLTLDQATDLPNWIETHLPTEAKKAIFFTNEQFHYQFKEKYEDCPPEEIRYFLGSKDYLDIICDRYIFYSYIQANTKADVPITISSSSNPWTTFGGPFYLRIRRSWKGISKLPRGRKINTQSELDDTVEKLIAEGHHPKEWVYQELLSEDPQDNLSICGWHDATEPIYYTTCPLIRKNIGTAVVVKLDKNNHELFEKTKQILDAFHYKGPFELEFIRDPNTNSYKVIELNPRFWMQHRLIGLASGNRLIKRYVGSKIDMLATNDQIYKSNYKIWVDRIGALDLIVNGQYKLISHLFRRSLSYPSWKITLTYFFIIRWAALKKRLGSINSR